MGVAKWSPEEAVVFLEERVRMAVLSAAAASDQRDRLERHMRRHVARLAANLGVALIDRNTCDGYAWAVYAVRIQDRKTSRQLRADWDKITRRQIQCSYEASELIEDFHAARDVLAQINAGH